MNIVGSTVRYPVTGCKRTEQSTVVKTMRTVNGEIALKLANGRVLIDPPFVLIKFSN